MPRARRAAGLGAKALLLTQADLGEQAVAFWGRQGLREAVAAGQQVLGRPVRAICRDGHGTVALLELRRRPRAHKLEYSQWRTCVSAHAARQLVGRGGGVPADEEGEGAARRASHALDERRTP